MENKDVIIICLIALIIYLYYQQNNQEVTDNSQKIKDLQNQDQHYQTLYQKRVEKDILGAEVKELQQLQTEFNQLTQTHQEQLRKINVLFDSNANNYETIDFNGLYELLEKIKEKNN